MTETAARSTASDLTIKHSLPLYPFLSHGSVPMLLLIPFTKPPDLGMSHALWATGQYLLGVFAIASSNAASRYPVGVCFHVDPCHREGSKQSGHPVRYESPHDSHAEERTSSTTEPAFVNRIRNLVANSYLLAVCNRNRIVRPIRGRLGFPRKEDLALLVTPTRPLLADTSRNLTRRCTFDGSSGNFVAAR
jgi:hypothetical protein